jgi:nickel/cobalt transporter (NicO) family protein
MSTALVFLSSAFMLGAAHALEPGHGKTVLSVHLSTSQHRLKDSFTVAALVTVLHALSVLLYAGLGVGLAHSVFQSTDQLLQQCGVFAGCLIVGIGVWWAIKAWQAPASSHLPNPHEGHTHPGHTHQCQHAHHMLLPRQGEAHSAGWSWRQLSQQFALALASSLTPCPSAIVVIIAMLSLGQTANWSHVLLFLLTFSVGVAVTMVAASALLTLPTQGLQSMGLLRITHMMPLFRKASAVAMLALGGFIMVKSLWFSEGGNASEINALLTIFNH